MTIGLNGKVAFVTGATKGLGQELALALAKAGADLVVVGRDSDGALATVSAAKALGRTAIVAISDITSEEQMAGAAKSAIGRFGRIDILVCAAGVGSQRQPVWACGATDFHSCFDVNVLGVMLAIRAVLPVMISQESGRVIAIGGTYGHKGVAQSAIYAASKWALRGLAKSVALEVGSKTSLLTSFRRAVSRTASQKNVSSLCRCGGRGL